MFDWIRKLFGEGYITFSMVLEDGRTAPGRVPYIGDINTLCLHEMRLRIIQEAWKNHQVRVISVDFTDIHGKSQ